MRGKLPYVVLAASAFVAVFSALGMNDRVRVVDIILLFGSGVGTGAGIVATVVQERLRRSHSPVTKIQ
jgi:hypothetical protein